MGNRLKGVLTALRGIGPMKQQKLQSLGVRTWSDILDLNRNALALPMDIADDIQRLEQAHEASDVLFLSTRLPKRLHYLLCLDFPQRTTFLDIEATGLSRVYHTVTLVGWGVGPEYHAELLGRERLPSGSFTETLSQRPLTVTFNGSLYDLPFLKTLRPITGIVSVDLRFLSFRLGYRGSQKAVEDALSIDRPPEFTLLRGGDAPALWFRAVRGDKEALNSLIMYNYLDIRGMVHILRRLAPDALAQDAKYSGLSQETHISLEAPKRPGHSAAELARRLQAIAPDRSPLIRVNSTPMSRALTVIGIDLTGSDAKPSGVASITGNHVSLSMLAGMDDIVQFVKASKANLVSIDAPLSIPAGRTRVDDQDPTRLSAGIMRESERELKRRGVNVYPCLLPSMQGLTQRGLVLAERLRHLGIPVIESYPGAAQDILAIPRKGVGTEFLSRALSETGLKVPLRATHDELDALTSAIVGILHLEGFTELLAGKDEDPMVVPDIRNRARSQQRAVVISGHSGSGKTTLGRILSQMGWTYRRFSQIIQDELNRRQIPPTRENMQAVGWDLHILWGQRAITRALINNLEENTRIVLDGARFLADVTYLREHFGVRLVHVHLNVPPETRHARLRSREGQLDTIRSDDHSVEQEIASLARFADLTDPNAGTLESLYTLAEKIQQFADRSLPNWVTVIGPGTKSRY